MSKHLFFLLSVTFILIVSTYSCNYKKHTIDSKVLTDTDRFYSALSAKKGMNAAFLAMFDSAGVKLQANHLPIEGYDSIRALLMSQNDSAFTLTWEPRFAKISTSGDMGYTYGIYTIKDKRSDSITGEGTYATVWQKKENDGWKAMLDTGNPGLGNLK